METPTSGGRQFQQQRLLVAKTQSEAPKFLAVRRIRQISQNTVGLVRWRRCGRPVQVQVRYGCPVQVQAQIFPMGMLKAVLGAIGTGRSRQRRVAVDTTGTGEQSAENGTKTGRHAAISSEVPGAHCDVEATARLTSPSPRGGVMTHAPIIESDEPLWRSSVNPPQLSPTIPQTVEEAQPASIYGDTRRAESNRSQAGILE